jgi:short-subunit dehydrogenase
MENVLITGTTSGIGKTFAEKFASMGNNIILVSRDRQKLEQQQLYLQKKYHVAVNFIAYDLSKEDAVDLIMEQICN